MADRTAGSRLQDHRQLQEGQRSGDRGHWRGFIDLCRRLDLFSHAMAAIDGSKFKAVNARDKNFTNAKLKKRMDQLDASVERYMAALETADRQEGELAKSVRLQEKIAALRE